MKNKIVIIVFLFFLSGIFCRPASLAQSAGTTGFDFLKMGTYPRPLSLGESFVAVSGDPAALYWNPAGLAPIDRRQFSFTTSTWLLDMKHYSLGFIVPSRIGVLGFSMGMFSYGNIAGYDVGGSPTGDLGGYDGLLNLSWGRKIKEFLYLGASLKYITEKIGPYSASGLALDLGSIVNTPFSGLSLGLNLQNIGGSLKFINEATPLPLNCKLGLAYQKVFRNDSLLFTSDINFSPGQRASWGAGLEYTLRNFLSLRSGLSFLQSGGSAMTAGLGLQTEVFNLDLAFTPYQDIGNVYHLGITLDFLPSDKELKAKRQEEIVYNLAAGRNYLSRQEYLKAVDEFNKVLSVDSDNIEALKYLKQAIAGIEAEKELRQQRAFQLAEQKQKEEEQVKVKTAKEAELARLTEQKRAEEISRQQQAEAARLAKEGEAKEYYGAAQGLLEAEEYDAALGQINKALDVWPDYTVAQSLGREIVARKKAKAVAEAEGARLAKQRAREAALLAMKEATLQLEKKQQEAALQKVREAEAVRLAEQQQEKIEQEKLKAAQEAAAVRLAEQKRAAEVLRQQQAVAARLAKEGEAKEYYSAAQGLLGVEEYDAALGQVNKALDVWPGYVAAQSLVKEIIERKKAKAVKDTEAVRLVKEREAAGYFNAGLVMSQRGEHEKAIDQFNQTLKIYPQHNEAMAELEKSRQAIAERKEAALRLAKEKELEEKRLAKQRVEDEALWAAQAALARQQEQAAAKQEIEKLAKAKELEQMLLAKQQAEEAARLAAKEAEDARLAEERLIEAAKLAAQKALAEQAELQKAREEARRFAKAQEAEDARLTDEWEKAVALETAKKAEEARQAAERQLKAEEEQRDIELSRARQSQVDGYFNLGKNSYDQGAYENAILFFSQALELVPDHELSRDYISRSKQGIELRKDKALDYYRQGLEKFNQGDYQAAIENLSLSLSFNPEFKRAEDLLARAEEKWEETLLITEAEEEPAVPAVVEKKIPLAKDRLPAQQAMSQGKKYLRNYRYLKARAEFEKVLRLLPGHQSAKKYLELTKKRQQAYLAKIEQEKRSAAAAKAKAAADQQAREKAAVARSLLIRDILLVGVMLVLAAWLIRIIFGRKK
ncbi:MAG: PorV/PorQ family protein [bacterium]